MYRLNARPDPLERRPVRYPLRGRWRLFRLRVHLALTLRVSGLHWMPPWPHVLKVKDDK